MAQQLRAAVYARLSASDDEASLDQQIAAGRAYAESRSWDVVGTYVEPKVSGFKERLRARPQGAKLWDQIETGNVDVVIVRHVDRLSRRAFDVLTVREACDIACYDQGIDTTRGDRLSLGVGAVIGEEESRVKSDRQSAFRQRARDAGRPRVGGTRAYGFESDGVTPRPDEQALIRKSAGLVARGASLRSVRKLWFESGVRNSKDGEVRQNVIRQVLLRGERYGVKPEVAKRVRAILEDPARQLNRQGANRRRFLLNGMVYCAECGSKMYGTRATRERTPYYRCSSPDGGCGVVSIQAEHLELALWAVVARERIFVSHEVATTDDLSGRAAELREELDAEEARAANKRRDYADDAIDARTLREALAVIEPRIDALRRELADVARAEASRETVRQKFRRLAAGPAGYDEARLLLETAVERVAIARTDRNPRVPPLDRATITWMPGWGSTYQTTVDDWLATHPDDGSPEFRAMAKVLVDLRATKAADFTPTESVADDLVRIQKRLERLVRLVPLIESWDQS